MSAQVSSVLKWLTFLDLPSLSGWYDFSDLVSRPISKIQVCGFLRENAYLDEIFQKRIFFFLNSSGNMRFFVRIRFQLLWTRGWSGGLFLEHYTFSINSALIITMTHLEKKLVILFFGGGYLGGLNLKIVLCRSSNPQPSRASQFTSSILFCSSINFICQKLKFTIFFFTWLQLRKMKTDIFIE